MSAQRRRTCTHARSATPGEAPCLVACFPPGCALSHALAKWRTSYRRFDEPRRRGEERREAAQKRTTRIILQRSACSAVMPLHVSHSTQHKLSLLIFSEPGHELVDVPRLQLEAFEHLFDQLLGALHEVVKVVPSLFHEDGKLLDKVELRQK